MSFELFRKGGNSNEGRRTASVSLGKRGISISRLAAEEMVLPSWLKVYADPGKGQIKLELQTSASPDAFKVQYKPKQILLNVVGLSALMPEGKYILTQTSGRTAIFTKEVI